LEEIKNKHETRFAKSFSRRPHESLRTNGRAVQIIGDFPFMLSLVEAFLGFFAESQYNLHTCRQNLLFVPRHTRVEALSNTIHLGVNKMKS
jgi:hypothetical protein